MLDREKIIKGFECCHVMVHDMGPDKSSCGICPYKDVQTEEQIDLGGIECIAVLHDDALVLLKEQKAMTERAAKITGGKRERVLEALEDKKRITEDGLFMLRDDEVLTLLNWLKELIKEEQKNDQDILPTGEYHDKR